VPDKENAKHFTGTKKCGGAKYHKGRQPDWCFAEPEPPEQGGEQLPFVICRLPLTIFFIFHSRKLLIELDKSLQMSYTFFCSFHNNCIVQEF
jgi:hypothetical protein